MQSVESIVVTYDGESKCGKTTVIESVAKEAAFQQEIIPDLLSNPEWTETLGQDTRDTLVGWHQKYSFDNITTLSAGNMFRAASLYVSLLELRGQSKTHFVPDDVDVIRELLALNGIEEVLQNDPNVGNRVSSVGAYAGVQALCGTLFCDYIVEAAKMSAPGRPNLVIVDARDPVGHMRRNNAIGHGERQIKPAAILPFYIDTPAEVAASRMSGDYNENLRMVQSRRLIDATREELPVVRPDHMIHSFSDWMGQFGEHQSSTEVATPYCLVNNADVSLDNIQYIAGITAAVAQNNAFSLW